MERTLSIVKPDAVDAGNAGNILGMIEKAGLRIVAMKLVHLTKEQASGFYAVHKKTSFFQKPAEIHHLRSRGDFRAGRRRRHRALSQADGPHRFHESAQEHHSRQIRHGYRGQRLPRIRRAGDGRHGDCLFLQRLRVRQAGPEIGGSIHPSRSPAYTRRGFLL